MKMLPWFETDSERRLAAWCALAFALGCTGAVEDPAQSGTGTPGGGGNSVAGNGSTQPGAGKTSTNANSGGSGGTTTPGAGAGSLGGNGNANTASGGANSTGNGGAGGVAPPFTDPPAFQPAAGMLRRLTRTQFRNAVRDVFGVTVDTTELDSDSWNGNFATVGASSVVTSERGVEQYQTAIENAANAVFSDATKRSQFIGCTPSGASSDSCIRTFVQSMGLRAWRRPLDNTETDRLVAIATKASTDLGSAVEGARWATVALFVSPNFLYRPELGATTNGKLRFTGYEMATRLAFLIWNSVPDKTLLDQAASGALGTTDGVRSAVNRMLDASAGREAVAAFAEEYMRLDRVLTQAKDPSLYAEYGATLQDAMVRDMRETWASIAFDDKASALSLFSSTKVVVNSELAKLYGLDPAGLTVSTFQTRSLPADGKRIGILSKAGFLSQFANQKEGSPTLRGKFMREALMCVTIPPPPPDVNLNLVEPPEDQPLTKRQRLEIHRTNTTCAACHSLMDPLGLPFENFDAIGRFRTTDRGLPIDPSGAFNGQNVADARALGQAISGDVAVSQCIVRKYYTYALGHEERSVDGSVLNTLAASFQASNFNLRNLILDVVSHDAFASVAPQ